MLIRRFSALLVALALTASAWRGPTRMSSGGHSSMPYLVVIVMDGFRADYATLAPMRHLHALMARGMTYETAWVGHLESETPTGHATIATGVYPRKHGVIGFGWRNAARDNFDYLPTDLHRIVGGDLTRLIEQGGVPTISDLIHAHNHRDVAVSMSGEKYYASAAMGAGADYVLYGKYFRGRFRPVSIGPNVPPASSRYTSITTSDASFDLQDRFAASLAVQMARTLKPRALFLNLPGTDIAGHYYGGMRDPGDMASMIRGDDWAIGQVEEEYQRLGLLNRTIFVVTADHGMASNRHIVPIHRMYKAVADTSLLTIDEEFRITMGSIWLRDPTRSAALAATLAARRFPGVEGALYKVVTPAGESFAPSPSTAAALPRALIQAYVDLADTEAAPSGPDVILPYSEDTTGLTVKGRKMWGSHGGFSWGVQHIPLVIAGPGVHQGSSHFPAKLVDIAPTIERLLGLPVPSGVDGVILADALSHASMAEESAQQGVQSRRMEDVRALEAHEAGQ